MEEFQVGVDTLSLAREDGWVPRSRPDKETTEYFLFPGN
jgi:hypothetical protein